MIQDLIALEVLDRPWLCLFTFPSPVLSTLFVIDIVLLCKRN